MWVDELRLELHPVLRPVSGPEAIDPIVDYLRFVHETAKQGKAADLEALDLARQMDLGTFAGLTDPARIVGNLYRAYAELDGAAPVAPIDTGSALRDMGAYNGGQALSCLA